MFITQISIHNTQDKAAFETFMKEVFIPTVAMSKDDNYAEITLLSKQESKKAYVYYYIYRYARPLFFYDIQMAFPYLGRVSATEKFLSFEPKIKRIGTFEVVSIRNNQIDVAKG
jgi:hypothetical protein